MRYVKVKGYFPYQHSDNHVETIDPGSVVGMKDEDIVLFLRLGMGEEVEGPENIIRPAKGDGGKVEHPGTDPRAARAESAVGRPGR